MAEVDREETTEAAVVIEVGAEARAVEAEEEVTVVVVVVAGNDDIPDTIMTSPVDARLPAATLRDVREECGPLKAIDIHVGRLAWKGIRMPMPFRITRPLDQHCVIGLWPPALGARVST